MASVRFVEEGDGEEDAVSFDLVNGMVRVADVLKEYAAVMVMVREEAISWKDLVAGTGGLSQMNFVAHSLRTIRVFRRRGDARIMPENRVKALVSLFKEQLVVARQAITNLPIMRVADELPLKADGHLDRKLGDYFMLAGREQTMKTQIEGAARLFNTYMVCKEQDVRECDSLLMLVGYPGAGKTTMGLDITAMLRQFWDEKMEEVDRILTAVIPSRDRVEKFKAMITNSKGFNCRMYRALEATDAGQLLPEEAGLGDSQILALNALCASFVLSDRVQPERQDFIRSYSRLLSVLDSEAPGLKEQLLIGDVIAFIREGLGIPPGHLIMLSWFFDEANVSRPAQGETVAWFQRMMSKYVQWMHTHRGADTFTIVTAATTRFSIASLQNTASFRAHSVYIPVVPLNNANCEDVVVTFLKRLRKTIGGNAAESQEEDVVLSEGLRNAIGMAAGNPRMLSYILTAFVTSSSAVEIHPRVLWDELSRSMRQEDMEKVILNSWKLIKDDYYAAYIGGSKMRLVLKAMQTSLLGSNVQRVEKVMDDFPDTWGDLESQGLVALVGSTREVKSARTPGHIFTKVHFSTMILRHFFSLSTDTLSKLLPPLESSDWKKKEKADLYTVMFLILVHKEVTGTGTFKLRDVLPTGWFIPATLEALEFEVPSCHSSWRVEQAGQLKTKTAFQRYMQQRLDCWAFIGPHNWGADSWLVMRQSNTGREMIFVFESKCCGCPSTLPVVLYEGKDSILEKAEKDLQVIADVFDGSLSSGGDRRKKRKMEEPPALFQLEQVVFFYVSDQNVTQALSQHKEACQRGVRGLQSRVVIAGDHPSDSPLCQMSMVRHMMQFTPKDEDYEM